MKRKACILLATVLAFSLLFVGCASKPINSGSGSHSTTKNNSTTTPTKVADKTPEIEWDDTIPALMIKANGKSWNYADLTPHLGQDNVWVEVPITIGDLENGLNNFVVHSNALNGGNRDRSTVDLYFTSENMGMGSYLSTDYMLSWEGFSDRRANVKLELKDGSGWKTVPTGETYGTDESTVIGMHKPTGGYFNMSRDITVENLSDYTEAKLLVNIHVGTNLLEPDKPEEPEVADPRDSTTPLLKVKVNKAKWLRYDLTPNKGNNDVWVSVPLPLESLNGGENEIRIDSNIKSIGNFNDQSLDVFFTKTTKPGNSHISTDGMLNWVAYEDRYINIKLEVNDGSGWKALPAEETEYKKDESTIVGLFKGDWEGFFNMKKFIDVNSLDGIKEARISLHLHVGSNLTLQDAK